MIVLRKANTSDLDTILDLFERTIRAVNIEDYSDEQIEVWANAKDEAIWTEKITSQHFYIAEIDHQIVGFSSIDDSGYLDFMYVHKDYQRSGIATSLLSQIEQTAANLKLGRIYSSVSITAQAFFISKGFIAYNQEHKEVHGVVFMNSLMHKIL